MAGLYEYWVCYRPHFARKTRYLPYPIVPQEVSEGDLAVHRPLRVFIGINRARSTYKGTDIMLRAAERVWASHRGEMELRRAESVPFAEYQRLMDGSDVILDQLYSYTPSMNSLLAMSKGIVCVGGGEEEPYALTGEEELRPVVNVQPTEESVVEALEWLVTHPDEVSRLKRESVAYTRRHHDYREVARRFCQMVTDL